MMAAVDFYSDTESVVDLLEAASGHLAFDIGANGGMVANQLAAHFDTVIALEPAIESYARLVGQAAPNVKPMNVACSSQAGTVTLRETTLTGHWGELFTGDTLPWGDHVGYREVPCTTVDALVVEYGIPDFLKVDVEGHEVEVLRGAEWSLPSIPHLLVEIHHSSNGAAVKGLLEKAGRTDWEVHEHAGYKASSPHRANHYWISA